MLHNLGLAYDLGTSQNHHDHERHAHLICTIGNAYIIAQTSWSAT